MIYILLDLFYVYDVLEFYIDEEMMYLYYDKYYNIYVMNLNVVIEKYLELGEKIVEELLFDMDVVLIDIKIVVCNNGGGYVNYLFFWEIMVLNVGGEFIGVIKEVINEVFGDFFFFKEEFKKVVVGCFGFGWVWFVMENGKLVIIFIVN